MKSYTFNLKEKSEKLNTIKNKETFDFSEFRSFNHDSFGFKRDWKTLSSHNDVEYVKRIVNPHYPYMLSSYKDTLQKNSKYSNYLIYIDFGKYKYEKYFIEFFDLELDIIITKDLKYTLLDMDELLSSFLKKKIPFLELETVLINMEKLINNFNKYGPINTLKKLYSEKVIKWLIE